MFCNLTISMTILILCHLARIFKIFIKTCKVPLGEKIPHKKILPQNRKWQWRYWCIKTFCFSNSALLSFILVDANLTVYILVQKELKFFATSLLFSVGSEINYHCSNITSICERDILFFCSDSRDPYLQL